eukprot:GGOE01014120.1.p1 GENE.GGOE01014120.1~~GGOE01014120.1.p1  ORF type:complete len:448 (+),score=66.47 GGOE01014120.1:26-1345(+)
MPQWPQRHSMRWIGAYLVAEVCFYQMWCHRQQCLSNEKAVVLPFDVARMTERILHCFVSRGWGSLDYRNYVEGWFQGASMNAIGCEDAKRWAAHMLFSKHSTELDEREEHIVDCTLQHLQAKAGLAFQPGKSAVEPMLHSFDPIQGTYIPLAVFGAVGLADIVGRGLLRLMGFRWVHGETLSGWYYGGSQSCYQLNVQSDAQDKTPEDICGRRHSPSPLVFFHGLGIGLFPYLHFIRRLQQECDRPMLLVDLPHISLTVFNFFPRQQAPTVPQAVNGITQLLQQCGHTAGCFIGHSYGSNYVVWMNRERPHVASGGTVLIDPIGFLLFEPDLVCNMLYQNRVSGPLSFLIRQDIHIRYACQRRFWWMQNTVFAEDLPSKAAVFLAANDNIVPAEKVHRYLIKHKAPQHICEMFPTRHGGILWTKLMQERVVQTVNSWKG